MRFRTILYGMSLLLLLGGCEKLPGLDFLSGPKSADPAQDVNRPEANGFRVGDRYTFDNPVTSWQVVAIEGEQVLWRSDNGDRQVTGFNPLLPPRQWWSRQDGNGRRFIRDRKGALFPMKVGAAMSFRATVTSSKPPFGWEYNWSCRVTGRETVVMQGDELETFVVVCGRENPDELTFNYAPKVGHYVVQRVAATADSPARTRKLLAYKRAGAVPVAANTVAPEKPPAASKGKPSNRAVRTVVQAKAAPEAGTALDSVSLRTPNFGGNIAPKPRKVASVAAWSAPVAAKKPVAKRPLVPPPPARPQVSKAVRPKPAVPPPTLRPRAKKAEPSKPSVPPPPTLRPRATKAEPLKPAVPPPPPTLRPRGSKPAPPGPAVPPPPRLVAQAPKAVPPPMAGPRIGAVATANLRARPVPPPPVAVPSVPPPPVAVPSVPPPVPALRKPPSSDGGLQVAVGAPAGVHLASYQNAANARQGWEQLARRNGALLRGLRADIRRVDTGEKGVYYRLYAVPLATAAAAMELCRKLRQRGVFCEPESS